MPDCTKNVHAVLKSFSTLTDHSSTRLIVEEILTGKYYFGLNIMHYFVNIVVFDYIMPFNNFVFIEKRQNCKISD